MRRADVEYSLFKFLKVLEWPVWLCIAGAYLFTSILLWVFDKFSPYSYTNNKEKYANEAEKREFTLKECLWFCMTSLTPQGGGEAPKNVSGRLVAGRHSICFKTQCGNRILKQHGGSSASS